MSIRGASAVRPVQLALLVTLAVLSVGVYRHLHPEWSSDGPVRIPPPHGYLVRKHVGQVFTDGLERVLLTGHAPGVLRKVEITGSDSDHFKVVGVMVAGPQRRLGSWEISDGFPPHKPGLGRLVPASGAFLPAGDGAGSLLLVGLKVVKPGLGVRAGIKIYYTVGDRKYVAVLPGGIVNCPKTMTMNQCFDLV